jgi:1-acyl-sn-glycerol-3-phosphate acyltransferase
MALESNATIVPTLIIGAEESNINLKTLKLARFLRGPILPLPLNIIPLPVKWKIVFLPPVRLPFGPEKLSDREFIKELAEDIQESMQKNLRLELKKKK